MNKERGRKRSVRSLLVIGVTAIALVACSSGQSQATDPSASESATEPTEGGRLVYALANEPPMINTAVSRGGPDGMVGCQFYPGLFTRDKEGTLLPHLAKDWTVSEDGLTITLNLVDNAKWQDGVPLTSADVQYSMMEVSKKYASSWLSGLSTVLESVDTPDDYTVVVNLSRPYGPTLSLLTCANAGGIIPKHVFEGTDVLTNEASLREPVSAGPFLLESWESGSTIKLVRNPDFWMEDKPYLDELVFSIIPNQNNMVSALQSGAVDFVPGYYLPQSSYQTLQNAPGIDTLEFPAAENDVIILNTRQEPLNDKLVRQALFTATDREAIIGNAFMGYGSPAVSAIDDTIPWANNPEIDLGEMYPFSVDDAKQMLDDAGYPEKDGTRFTLDIVYDSGNPSYDLWAQQLEQMWGDVGVKVNLRGEARAVMIEDVFTKYDFDANITNYSTGLDPAIGISRLYTTDSIVQGLAFNNASGFSDPEVDALFSDGANAADEETRGEAYRKVATILADELPTLPISSSVKLNAWASKVGGLGSVKEQSSNDNAELMHNVWVSK